MAPFELLTAIQFVGTQFSDLFKAVPLPEQQSRVLDLTATEGATIMPSGPPKLWKQHFHEYVRERRSMN